MDSQIIDTSNTDSDIGENVPFSYLSTARAREMKARDSAPGTYMVVYTPDNFKKHPRSDGYFDDMEDTRPRRGKTYRSDSGVSCTSVSTTSSKTSSEPPISPSKHLTSGPDSKLSPGSTHPAKDEDILFGDLTHRLNTTKALSSPPLSDVDVGSNSTTIPFAEDAELIDHYQRIVSKTLLPTLSKCSLGNDDDPFLNEADKFPPLRHALYAITSLSLAVNSQRSSEDALLHYRQALESSVNLIVDPHTDGVLYMHYVLMLYDTCYEAQTPSEEHTDVNKSIWARHLGILFNLVIKRHEADIRTPAWMLRQLLELDIQACLSGNAFGGFARAFLNRDLFSVFEDVFSIDTHTRPEYSEANEQALKAVLCLWSGTMYRMARIARLTVRLRSQIPSGGQSQAAFTEKQKLTVNRYYSDLCAFWTREYPSFLPFASAELPLGIKHLFDSVRRGHWNIFLRVSLTLTSHSGTTQL